LLFNAIFRNVRSNYQRKSLPVLLLVRLPMYWCWRHSALFCSVSTSCDCDWD